MEPASSHLYRGTEPNPFHEAQAKTFGDDKLVGEFLPTSIYTELFNEQHEILIGSRGSGKTALLRMLSYSCFSKIKDAVIQKIADQNRFFGFYIPLHLEFMASLPQDTDDGSCSTEFFQFAFNCAAAKAFLTEIRTLLNLREKDSQRRLEKEAVFLKRLHQMWKLNSDKHFLTLEDLAGEIDMVYFQQHPWKDKTHSSPPLFAKHLFSPIIAVLPLFCTELGIDFQKSHWLACVDEAEFLKPAYLKCFNTFMRSDNRPIVLKLATLPFKYSSMETQIPGVTVECNGNDFNFRSIDLSWESKDFRLLVDHLCKMRLQRIKLFAEGVTLKDFVGQLGNDDPKDYYKEEFSNENTNDDKILEDIISELSRARRDRFEQIRDNPERVASDYFKKFSPVFYMRRMKREEKPGNRKVGFFAGPTIIRRIADGNPRRFIQLMYDMFDQAKKTKLSWKAQHEVVESFASRECERAAGLPEFGILLDIILNALGTLMETRVHGKEYMVESGFNFVVREDLLANSSVRSALELGIAYSFMFVEGEESLFLGITKDSNFRLSHVVATKYWLPMRNGTPVTLQSRNSSGLNSSTLLSKVPVTMNQRDAALKELQLDFFENIQSSENDEI